MAIRGYSSPYSTFTEFAVALPPGAVIPPSMRVRLRPDDAGWVELNTVPELRVESLQATRQTGYCAEITLQLYHNRWGDLEYLLVNSVGRACRVRWGFTANEAHGPGASSPTYFAYMQEIHPTYSADGVSVQLKIQGAASVSTQYLSGQHLEGWVQDYDIGQMVEWLCKEQGWVIGRFEPTAPIWSRDGSFTKEAVKRRFCGSGMTVLEFINRRLIPYAVSAKDGAGGYSLIFHEEAKGGKPQTVVDFLPLRFSWEPQRKFTVYRDRLGEVLEFSPDLNLLAVYSGQGGHIAVPAIDPFSKEITVESVRPDSSLKGEKTGPLAFFPSDLDLYSKYHNIPPEDASALQAWLQSEGQAGRVMSYPASMQIVGDPELRVNQTIEVAMFSTERLLMDCSGEYLVQGVTDQVAGGQYTTSLQLLRNASFVGAGASGGQTSPLQTEVTAMGGVVGGGSGGGRKDKRNTRFTARAQKAMAQAVRPTEVTRLLGSSDIERLQKLASLREDTGFNRAVLRVVAPLRTAKTVSRGIGRAMTGWWDQLKSWARKEGENARYGS